MVSDDENTGLEVGDGIVGNVIGVGSCWIEGVYMKMRLCGFWIMVPRNSGTDIYSVAFITL